MYSNAIFNSICLKIPFTFQNTECDHLFKVRIPCAADTGMHHSDPPARKKPQRSCVAGG